MANTSRPGLRRQARRDAASRTGAPPPPPGCRARARLMMRLRRGKCSRCGTVRGGNSDTSAPRAAMRAASAACSGGWTRSSPVPHTATVSPARLQRALVAGRVDPGGEAAGDGEPGAREPGGEFARRGAPGRRRAARADHGELRRGQHPRIPEHVQRRRRGRGLPQQRRIPGIGAQENRGAARGEPVEVGGQRRRVGRGEEAARRRRQLHRARGARLDGAARLAARRRDERVQLRGAELGNPRQQRACRSGLHAGEHKPCAGAAGACERHVNVREGRGE